MFSFVCSVRFNVILREVYFGGMAVKYHEISNYQDKFMQIANSGLPKRASLSE